MMIAKAVRMSHTTVATAIAQLLYETAQKIRREEGKK
jgi:hypothetical protein